MPSKEPTPAESRSSKRPTAGPIEITLEAVADSALELRKLARAIAGDDLLTQLGGPNHGYEEEAQRVTAHLFCERSGRAFTDTDDDRRLLRQMYVCALAQLMNQHSELEAALRDSEFAGSAVELSEVLSKGSNDCSRWAEKLVIFRRAAKRLPRKGRRVEQLSDDATKCLEGLSADRFNLVLVRRLGHAALLASQSDSQP